MGTLKPVIHIVPRPTPREVPRWLRLAAVTLATVWLAVVAVCGLFVARAWGEPLGICQPDFANVAEVHVYNFRTSPVPDVEPSPVPDHVRTLTVPMPAQRTPVPAVHHGACAEVDTTTYLLVEAGPLTGPGLANRWVAWAVSVDGIASTRSNVLTPAPFGPPAPKLLP